MGIDDACCAPAPLLRVGARFDGPCADELPREWARGIGRELFALGIGSVRPTPKFASKNVVSEKKTATPNKGWEKDRVPTCAKERKQTTQGRDGRTARRHHTGILRRGVWCAKPSPTLGRPPLPISLRSLSPILAATFELRATSPSPPSRRALPCRFFLCRVALLCLVPVPSVVRGSSLVKFFWSCA